MYTYNNNVSTDREGLFLPLVWLFHIRDKRNQSMSQLFIRVLSILVTLLHNIEYCLY